jgi:thiamine transport system permease protein
VLLGIGMAGRRTAISRRAPTVRRRLATGRARLGALAAALPALILVLVPTLELLRRATANDAYGLRHLAEVPSGFPTSPARAIVTSLGIAITATVIAVGLGLMLAAALTRRRRPGRIARLTEVLVVLPLGVSAVTVGFGFLITFDTPPVDLRTSWWIIPIAHALVALPFVLRATVPVLRGIDHRQREAAAVLGAHPFAVWRAVDGPVVARAAAVAAAFAFAISLGEFGATLFIVRPETTTVPVAIYRLLGRPGATNTDLAMTLAAILMVLTGAVAFLTTTIGARRSAGS